MSRWLIRVPTSWLSDVWTARNSPPLRWPNKHKARAAASFRRPTKVFEDGVQKSDNKYLLSLDGIIASRGGIPLIEDGKLIGAIGCSGATGAQDEAACMAGAATINK
jgi:glc operon protein GlcG